jgi:ribosome biogenesis GTPase
MPSDPHGIVIRSTGSWISVLSKDGKVIECRIKGKFRIAGVRSTNPVAVGDKVQYRMVDHTGVITAIGERHNYIVRKATRLSSRSHIIAANIDQAILIVTLASPRTSTGFIDRFLVTAEAYHIPARLVFNKADIMSDEQLGMFLYLKSVYEAAGYPSLLTSALEKQGVDAFTKWLKDKVSLLSGHSGVGKSALVNAVEPGLNLKTGAISDYHDKGKHTTTFAEMHPLSFGGFIIDTPGIKEFGLIDFERTEVGERFPEMRALMAECRFADCTHVHEPGCAVKRALDEGLFPEFRYSNYISILNDDYWEETESYD